MLVVNLSISVLGLITPKIYSFHEKRKVRIMESKERTGEDQEKLQSTESGTIYDKTKSVSEEHSENQNDDDNEKLKSTLEIGAEHEDEMEEVLSERVKEVNYI